MPSFGFEGAVPVKSRRSPEGGSGGRYQEEGFTYKEE